MLASFREHSNITKNYSSNGVRRNHTWCIIIALTFVVFMLSFSTIETFESILPIVAGQETSSQPCPELPNDGKPQSNKGANTDSQTWKVVPMKKDPSKFKVVDSDGIPVAVRFQSKSNAEQYIAHFVCAASPTPSAPSPVEVGKEYDVQITTISSEGPFTGNGIAHVNEFPIFVSDGKLGQNVTVKISGIDNRGFAVAGIVKVNDPPTETHPSEPGPSSPDFDIGGAPLTVNPNPNSGVPPHSGGNENCDRSGMPGCP